jgi:hypothetical protein
MPQQVISEESVRATVDRVAQQNTVFRNAFQDIAVPDRTGSTYDIPVSEDVLGEPTSREPGASIDFGREEYRAETIEREEYANGSRITEEAIEDTSFNLVDDTITSHAEKMAEKLDAEAFEVLKTAADASAPNDDISLPAGSDNGDELVYEDIVDAEKVLESREGGYRADLVFVGTEAKAGIKKDLADRETGLGDSTYSGAGIVANYNGLDVVYSDNNLLTANDAILVDSERFGYEGEWMGVSTDTKDDFDTKAIKLTSRWKGGWVATQPRAAIRVRG